MSSDKMSNASSSQTLKTPDGTLVRCLYVSNIPSIATEKDLCHLFVRYGTIVQIFLKKNGLSKRNTYAFITFELPEVAFRVHRLSKGILKLGFNKLYISVADTWHQPTVQPDGTLKCYRPYNPLIDYNSENVEVFNEKDNNNEEEDEQDDVDIKVETVIQDSPISRLNDDCLLHIISFIPFYQRHTVSHVCHRWRNLMSVYWAKFKVLNFDEEPFRKSNKYGDKYLLLYLTLCPNIKSVHLINENLYSLRIMSRKKIRFDSQSIINVATLCGDRLEELTLSRIIIKHRPFPTIAHSCKNIKSLTMKGCTFNRFDHEMSLFLKKSSKLETLYFANCEFKPGYWLKHLSSNIKYLSFTCCEMNILFLIQGLSFLKSSLKEFVLMSKVMFTPFNLEIFREFKNLESLVFVEMSEFLCLTYPPNVFQNLRKLHLQMNSFVTSDIISGIVKYNPHLKSLNLGNCRNTSIKPESFFVLAELKELEYLNLSMNCITDELLGKLAENKLDLTNLSINECLDISDKGCKKILENLMKLELLSINSCHKITNKTVEAAMAVASSNPSKPKLIIHCADTGIPYLLAHINFDHYPYSKVNLLFPIKSMNLWLFENTVNDLDDCQFLHENGSDDEEEYDFFDIDDSFDHDFEFDDFDSDDLDFDDIPDFEFNYVI